MEREGLIGRVKKILPKLEKNNSSPEKVMMQPPAPMFYGSGFDMSGGLSYYLNQEEFILEELQPDASNTGQEKHVVQE